MIQKETNLQQEAVFGIIQVNSGDFLDSLQAVYQGASVDEKCFGCLEGIAFVLQIHLQCAVKLSFIFFIILDQGIEPGGNQELRADLMAAL